MVTRTVDPYHFIQRVRQIKVQLPILLSNGYVEIHIQSSPPEPVDHHTALHQRLERFLKFAESLDEQDNTTTQPMPDILLVDENEFEQKLAEYEALRNENDPQILQSKKGK